MDARLACGIVPGERGIGYGLYPCVAEVARFRQRGGNPTTLLSGGGCFFGTRFDAFLSRTEKGKNVDAVPRVGGHANLAIDGIILSSDCRVRGL